LILEALRKLEREKRTPERSLVVTGASAWARPEGHPTRRLAGGIAGVMALGVAFFLWRGTTAHAPAPPQAASSSPSSAVTTTPAATAQAFGAPLGAQVPGGPRSVAMPIPVTPRPSTRAAAADGGRSADPGDEPARAEASLDSPTPSPVPPAGAETDSPAVQPAPTPGDVVLQAITERDGQPIAIVNGRLVRAGDAFDGIRILRIGTAEIEVEVRGERRIISF
jgi:hypothetical protein